MDGCRDFRPAVDGERGLEVTWYIQILKFVTKKEISLAGHLYPRTQIVKHLHKQS